LTPEPTVLKRCEVTPVCCVRTFMAYCVQRSAPRRFTWVVPRSTVSRRARRGA